MESILARIDKTGDCWLWQGGTTKGYGRVMRGGKNLRVHRLMYEEYVGKIPEGMCVCHMCDVRNCCNPDHLFLATNAENHRDKSRKGRANKTSDEVVASIREKYAQGASQGALAIEYGLARTTVGNIVNHRYPHDGGNP